MAENTSAQQLPHAGAYHHAAGVPQGKMNEEWTPAAYAEYYNNVLEPYYQNLVYAQHPMAYSPAYMMGHHPMAYYYPAAYMADPAACQAYAGAYQRAMGAGGNAAHAIPGSTNVTTGAPGLTLSNPPKTKGGAPGLTISKDKNKPSNTAWYNSKDGGAKWADKENNTQKTEGRTVSKKSSSSSDSWEERAPAGGSRYENFGKSSTSDDKDNKPRARKFGDELAKQANKPVVGNAGTKPAQTRPMPSSTWTWHAGTPAAAATPVGTFYPGQQYYGGPGGMTRYPQKNGSAGKDDRKDDDASKADDASKRSKRVDLKQQFNQRLLDEEVMAITTLMVKNIPNKLTKADVLKTFDDQGINCDDIDFFYIPRDGRRSSNLGYCFINFGNGDQAKHFVKTMEGYSFPSSSSKKVLSVCPAHVQGLVALSEHFKNAHVKSSNDGPCFLNEGSNMENDKKNEQDADTVPSMSIGSGNPQDGGDSRHASVHAV